MWRWFPRPVSSRVSCDVVMSALFSQSSERLEAGLFLSPWRTPSEPSRPPLPFRPAKKNLGSAVKPQRSDPGPWHFWGVPPVSWNIRTNTILTLPCNKFWRCLVAIHGYLISFWGNQTVWPPWNIMHGCSRLYRLLLALSLIVAWKKSAAEEWAATEAAKPAVSEEVRLGGAATLLGKI